MRALKERDLEEAPSTRLLVYAAALIGAGLAVEDACRVAIIDGLTDDPPTAAALMDVRCAARLSHTARRLPAIARSSLPMPAFSLPTILDRRLAIIAESLYLANLLIAPGFAFLGLLWLWRRADVQSLPLARQHLRQTLAASLWGRRAALRAERVDPVGRRVHVDVELVRADPLSHRVSLPTLVLAACSAWRAPSPASLTSFPLIGPA